MISGALQKVDTQAACKSIISRVCRGTSDVPRLVAVDARSTANLARRHLTEHRRRYGYRWITAELHRRGMQINHPHVVRIMREDNLLGLQPQRFKVTTNSNHKFEVYLNLAARMKLNGIHQALGSGHHLHSAEGGICLLGGDIRRVLTKWWAGLCIIHSRYGSPSGRWSKPSNSRREKNSCNGRRR
jgi:helix-turn-helix protein